MAEANEITTKSLHHTSSSSNSSRPFTIEQFLRDFYPQQIPIVENSIVIWLDANINRSSNDYKSLINQVQQLVHLIVIFTDPDQCIDFISDIKNEKIFLIGSGNLGQRIISVLHDIHEINSIYIYCDNKSKHEKWANKEKKIQRIFTKIPPIYDLLRRDIRQCEDDLNSFHILSSKYYDNHKLNQSNQLFIYIQILKEILIQLEYPTNMKKDFVNFCHLLYQNNSYQSNVIAEFKNDYKQSLAIWWYTRECFISSMLSKAFRMRDLYILIHMGFFIRDLHQEMLRLYSKVDKQNPMTVYRGQGISEREFENILDNQNGFLSFNNFLITTTDKNLSLTYARSTRDNYQLIGVLFQMEIDPTKAIFTSLDKINYYSESEKEILFTTQTIFRVHMVNQIEHDLWQIQLKLTTDEDEQLKHIKELIQKEIQDKNRLEQLHTLMTKMHMLYEFGIQPAEMDSEQIVEDLTCQVGTESSVTEMEIVQEDTGFEVNSKHTSEEDTVLQSGTMSPGQEDTKSETSEMKIATEGTCHDENNEPESVETRIVQEEDRVPQLGAMQLEQEDIELQSTEIKIPEKETCFEENNKPKSTETEVVQKDTREGENALQLMEMQNEQEDIDSQYKKMELGQIVEKDKQVTSDL